MLAIYKKELSSYFNSVMACLYVAITTLFSGLFFMLVNINGVSPYINEPIYYTMYFITKRPSFQGYMSLPVRFRGGCFSECPLPTLLKKCFNSFG